MRDQEQYESVEASDLYPLDAPPSDVDDLLDHAAEVLDVLPSNDDDRFDHMTAEEGSESASVEVDDDEDEEEEDRVREDEVIELSSESKRQTHLFVSLKMTGTM